MKLNSSLRGKIYRILQFIIVSCVLIIPFIKTSNGNSLFRFDIPTLQLHAFNGVVKFSNFFNAFIGILLVTFLFIFITQLLGRIWCGWLCPQSFFAIRIDNYVKIFKNHTMRKIADKVLSAIFALVLSANWIMYFVSPYDYFSTLTGSGGKIMAAIWIVLFLFLFIDFAFVRFRWCKYICPYSKFQVLMTDSDTLYVGMIPGKEDMCINCMACVRACPTKIDPRKNPDADCIYCETCVTACNHVFEKKQVPGLLGYVWGSNDKLNLKRPNLIITFLVSVALFVVLLYSMIFKSDVLVVDISENITKVSDTAYKVEAVLHNNSTRPIRVNFKSVPESAADIKPQEVRVFATGKKEVVLDIKLKEKLDGNTLKLESWYIGKDSKHVFKDIILK